MKQTILEQFKVIEDAVRDLKEMIDTPASKDWFATWPNTPSTPENTDGEGNFITPNQNETRI